jgi:hypothetical protein
VRHEESLCLVHWNFILLAVVQGDAVCRKDKTLIISKTSNLGCSLRHYGLCVKKFSVSWPHSFNRVCQKSLHTAVVYRACIFREPIIKYISHVYSSYNRWLRWVPAFL